MISVIVGSVMHRTAVIKQAKMWIHTDLLDGIFVRLFGIVELERNSKQTES